MINLTPTGLDLDSLSVVAVIDEDDVFISVTTFATVALTFVDVGTYTLLIEPPFPYQRFEQTIEVI